MQKERKKQAKNPFGVMKKEEEERRKKEGEEKQELEFAEGFRRIKNLLNIASITADLLNFLLAFQGKTITKCIFGLNWVVSTLFTFTEFVYNF